MSWPKERKKETPIWHYTGSIKQEKAVSKKNQKTGKSSGKWNIWLPRLKIWFRNLETSARK